MELKSLVVLGAGFGGLSAAKALAKKTKGQYRVTLIDRNPKQIFTPTLPDLEIEGVDLKIIAQKHGFDFQVNEIIGLDIQNKIIRLTDRNITYDGLILALGMETEYFNIPGIKENSISLKSNLDAEKIQEKIKNFQGSEKIIIIGAGPTGVELAGTLFKKGKITLVEKGSTILSSFSEKLQDIATKRLIKNGVEIITNCGAIKATADTITLEACGDTKFDLLVWAAGAKGPSTYQNSGLDLDPRGRALVEKDLQINNSVFAIGDGMTFRAGRCPTGVRPAIVQGKLAAKNLLASLNNKKTKEYSCRNYPYILPIGRFWAAIQLGNFVLTGPLPRLLQKIIHQHYLKTESQ
jgi:NADH dehydrogenase